MRLSSGTSLVSETAVRVVVRWTLAEGAVLAGARAISKRSIPVKQTTRPPVRAASQGHSVTMRYRRVIGVYSRMGAPV